MHKSKKLVYGRIIRVLERGKILLCQVVVKQEKPTGIRYICTYFMHAKAEGYLPGAPTRVLEPQLAAYDLIPDLFPYLRDYEQVRRVDTHDLPPSGRLAISVDDALQRLAGGEVIGARPLVAACPADPNEERLELKRFQANYGRDGLFQAIVLDPYYPNLTRRTVVMFASKQGISYDAQSDQEPGKIPHEDREQGDPIRQILEEQNGWKFPYYGSVDSTLWFIKAAAMRCRKEDSLEFLQEEITGMDGQTIPLEVSVFNALQWTLGKMDEIEQGFVEFQRKASGGLPIQSWKDSWDSHHHADGRIANPENSIASVEVQVLAYDALLDVAELFPEYADDLLQKATHLKENVMNTFWTEDSQGGYFALGSERNAHSGLVDVFRIRTSNMGWLLNSRILEGDDFDTTQKRESLIRTLFSPDMLNCSGIRTLSTNEKRFKPTAYHNGNVWSWDNYWIAQGLERHGYHGLAWDLYKRIPAVVEAFGGYPEYARGGNEPTPKFNTRTVIVYDGNVESENCVEQPPQEIQGYTVVSAADVAFRLYKGTLPQVTSNPQLAAFEKQILQVV